MIVATAGHVDHGKTTLIKQLTGVDTDRLDEEKRRGLSIDLGFAYKNFESCPEHILGFIDVPGHQRFINTMISGVFGIDLGMLVTAADDGPMPQTREHLDILRLLGINEFIIVISKIDRVDQPRVEEVARELTALAGNYMEAAPRVFLISGTTGEGVPDLMSYFESRLASHPTRPVQGNFRISIDRAFTLKGIGLVVTGTVMSGEIHTGDFVRLLPHEKTLRVRSIHAQDQPVSVAGRGVRCALNITGDIDKPGILKGDWLVGMEAAGATSCLTATFEQLQSPVKIRHRMPVKLYLGAKHVPAKLGLLKDDPDLVQLFPDDPVCCCRGDRFLLRDNSENFLLGGGEVLDPFASRNTKLAALQRRHLDALKQDDFTVAAKQLLMEEGMVIDYLAFRQAWNLREQEALTLLEQAAVRDQLVFLEVEKLCFALSEQTWQAMLERVKEAVRAWHQQHPDQQGLPVELLLKQTKNDIDGHLMPGLLNALQEVSRGRDRIVQVGGVLRVAVFREELSPEAQGQWRRVEQILLKHGLEIPLVSELEKKSGLKSRELNHMISTGLKTGRLRRISQKRVGLPATLKEISGKVISMTEKKPKFTVIDFRDHIGTGRNYAIEILDFMDDIGFTRREGNERMIVDKKVPDNLFN